jgi:hypothetical protein
MAHYHIYLGRERGKRTIHKVGQTTQTCYARCRSSDYLIGMSYELIFPEGMIASEKKKCLNEAERFIIENFGNKFKVVHGHEYFRTTKKQWDEIRKIFITEMTGFLAWKGWAYEVHEGWVAPNTY